ncbi:uncharacterized protein EAF01_004963 [Botrytis porri]|uniref:F-box domain-containing protein n=1 Tax=Botrytis porri TaxID=87229 RepID=A0A4Z1L247_9HELO|nr:uncharacterized protein EAF01_004963 [Botrytis porri]KAF7907376.1 hypothetical protein EAF01_004963 [Botrytis porri]TGO90786.1 hypothetical protein BPOR_0051g00210 [Botrytis porri]
MPKRKNKLNRADRLRRDTAHIEPHKGLKIVEGSFLVITISNDWKVQNQRRGSNYLLARLPGYLKHTRRIRIEMLCRDPNDRRTREDATRKSKMLTSIRKLLNKSNKIDRLEVIFHMKKEDKFDPYIPQLQAVVPLYNLKFTEWTLHCHWKKGLKIIEVKRNSELERKITTHPWFRFEDGRLLSIKIDHTKKYRLRKEIKYVDEREKLQESFFNILPLFLSQADEIRIKVTPLKRKYLLVRMLNDRKMMIDKMILLINRYRNVKTVEVIFRVDERESDYLDFAISFLNLKPAWELFVDLDEGEEEEITMGSLVARRILQLRTRSSSGTSLGVDRLTNLCGDMIMAVMRQLSPTSASSLRACNRLLESIIDPPRL